MSIIQKGRLKLFLAGAFLGCILVAGIFLNRQLRRDSPSFTSYTVLDSNGVYWPEAVSPLLEKSQILFYGEKTVTRNEIPIRNRQVIIFRNDSDQIFYRVEWHADYPEEIHLWRADQVAVFPQPTTRLEDLKTGLRRIGYPALESEAGADGWWLVKVKDPGLPGITNAEWTLLSHPLYLVDVRRVPVDPESIVAPAGSEGTL